MDFTIPPELEQFRATVRRFVDTELIPLEDLAEENDGLPDEIVRDLRKKAVAMGLNAISMPEEFGGGGLGTLAHVLVTEQLSRAAPGVTSGVIPNPSNILQACNEEQRERYLLPCIRGEKQDCFALTEPDAGSNSHRITTVARKAGDRYVLSGQKVFISGVDESDAMLVVTRTGTDERTGRGQLSLFVVDTRSPGIDARPIPMEVVVPEKQFTVFFNDVEVPADRLLGGEGRGLRVLFDGLNPERIISAAYSCGLARYALDRAVAYANERKVWGAPIGAHQGLSHPLARAKLSLELARLMTAKAAWLYDAGKDAGEAANMARLAAGDAAIAALDQAIQIHGGNGLATEYGLATMWGMARLQHIAPVSREMILNFIAQHSLGLPRSY